VSRRRRWAVKLRAPVDLHHRPDRQLVDLVLRPLRLPPAVHRPASALRRSSLVSVPRLLSSRASALRRSSLVSVLPLLNNSLGSVLHPLRVRHPVE
jgi:hypothetical protein